MKSKGPMSGTAWKGIIIAEVIVCYLAGLAVVSYIRGPERYQVVEGAPQPQTEEFVSFDGAPAEAGGILALENVDPGKAVGYMTRMRLRESEKIQISFQIECPAEFAGGTLYVDLYNYEAGYDNPEQEYQLIVREGHNEAEFLLTPGERSPEEASLRIFTLDPAGYRLENVRVSCVQQQGKVPVELYIGAILCFVLLAVTASMWMIDQEEEKKGGRQYERRDEEGS